MSLVCVMTGEKRFSRWDGNESHFYPLSLFCNWVGGFGFNSSSVVHFSFFFSRAFAIENPGLQSNDIDGGVDNAGDMLHQPNL